jgi:hypothetical protein
LAGNPVFCIVLISNVKGIALMVTVEIEALQKIKERLLQNIPEHFVSMYAFGSRVGVILLLILILIFLL